MKPRFIFLVFLLLAVLALFFIDPTQHRWVPQCPFKLLTGWSCPGCGIQRAAHAVLHGDLSAALRYNWFLVFSLPYATLLIIAQWFVGRDKREKMMRSLGHRYTVYTYVTLFFIWWIARNILGI